MQKNIVKKGLIIAVICMFIIISFQPIIAENTISVEKESDYNNADLEETKEYLFQTLIDIANNPNIKTFLNENKHNLITNDYDCKNAIQKIWLEKPKLLRSILFIKPEMTYEYLKTNYNNGMELNNILLEEESLKIIKSVKINNPVFFYDLKNIIMDDKELHYRITILEKMNNKLKSNQHFSEFPIICEILFIILIPLVIVGKLLLTLTNWALAHSKPLLASISYFITDLILLIGIPISILILLLNCV